MAKKKRKATNNTGDSAAKPKPEAQLKNEPWVSRQSGLLVMGLFSLAFAGFVAWQLHEGLGWGPAILWGLGFGLGMWAVFGLSLAFNTWMRSRR